MRTSLASALCYLITHCTAQPTNSKLSNSTVPTTNETITCISPADAILIANGFGHILSNFSMAFGDTLIAEGYTDQSDSVATLSHSPNLVASDLGKTTFSSKASFLAGEQAQPGVAFALLNTWPSCSAVTFRYVLSPPSGLKVQGIAVAEVEMVAQGNATGVDAGVGEGATKWQIKTFWGEFNSAVWLSDVKSVIQGCDVTANATVGAVGGNVTIV